MSANYWEDVYQAKEIDQVSWYQAQDTKTIEVIQSLVPFQQAQIIDVGSGASVLIDQLVAANYRNLHVLDLSETALAQTKQRLSANHLDDSSIQWIVDDVGQAQLPAHFFDLWHDRAVFHFMVSDAQKTAYLKNLKASLKVNAFVMISTFAENGPEKCSGLTVERYSVEKLQETLGEDFKLLRHEYDIHLTPWASEQNFLHSVWRYEPEA